MKKTVPRCQLFIFFSSDKALNSNDCINEIKLARKHNIQITPILGVNLKSEDLEKLNVIGSSVMNSTLWNLKIYVKILLTML